MATNLRSDIIELGSIVTLLSGAADPSAGAGVVANIGSGYYRSGTGQLWIKTGAGNTAWTQLDTAAPAPVAPPITGGAGNGLPWYGQGFDGNLVFDGVSNVNGIGGMSIVPAAGVYTLPRDISANNMTVDPGVTVLVGGCRIFVLNTLTNNGTISAAGNNGSNGAAGAGGNGGTVPVAINTRTLYTGHTGGNGGAPTAGGNAGTGSTQGIHVGAAAGATTTFGTKNGGVMQGGAGGSNEAGAGAGGNGGTNPAFNSSDHFWAIGRGMDGLRQSNSVQLGTGSGGGGGRGGTGAGTGGGGGGGASGGTLVLGARVIAGNGTITAAGGNGGNGANTNGGAGGGGAGGAMLIVTNSDFPLTNTVTVAGGNPGTPGSGVAATAGSGGAGIVYQFKP